MSVSVRRITVALLMTSASLLALPAQAQDASWMAQLIQKISQNQTTPRIAQLRKIEGITVMRVKLDGFGMILGYEVATSSGSDILDNAAQNCLDRIGQFSPPPDNQAQTVLLKIRWVAG
jgi:TonB family protein